MSLDPAPDRPEPVESRRAPFFTIARFEPDTLALAGILVGAASVLLLTGLVYLSAFAAGAAVAIFLVECFETLSPDNPEQRQIVGARCLLLRPASATEKGVARLVRADGRLDPELWSVEATSPIAEGETAVVSGTRSVVLLVARVSDI